MTHLVTQQPRGPKIGSLLRMACFLSAAAVLGTEEKFLSLLIPGTHYSRDTEHTEGRVCIILGHCSGSLHP